MKRIILGLAIILTCHHLGAQFPSIPYRFVDLMNKSLVVSPVETENPKVIDELKKKEEHLAIYRDQIDKKNTMMREVIGGFWNFTDSIQFKTWAQIDSMKEAGLDVVILDIASHDLEKTVVTGHTSSITMVPGGTPGGFVQKTTYSSIKEEVVFASIPVLRLSTTDFSFDICLPSPWPKKSELTLSLLQLQYLLELTAGSQPSSPVYLPAQISANTAELSSKILLFNQDDLHSKLTAEEIKNFYPYTFQVVDQTTIDSRLKEKNQDFAIIQLMPFPHYNGQGFSWCQVITNAGDGKILCYLEPSSLFMLTTYNPQADRKIKQSHMEDLSELVSK